MASGNKDKIKQVVYTFASILHIEDSKVCDEMIDKLTNMELDDAIDRIIVSLSEFVTKGDLTEQDLLNNADVLLSLYPEKYSSIESFYDRFHYLENMNLKYPEVPLAMNHRLVISVFDKFNELIGNNFDCYYVGGLMGYLATSHSLERYHGDLDLLINEEELEKFYHLILENDEFSFINNMDKKEPGGHEFKIQYNHSPMSIGLFLFERLPDGKIIRKEYYRENGDSGECLYVDEHHLSSDYSNLIFSDQVRMYDGFSYKMCSLESIYNTKKCSTRPKDRFDCLVIEDAIDKYIDYQIDVAKKDNYDVFRKSAAGSVVSHMEQVTASKQNKSKL